MPYTVMPTKENWLTEISQHVAHTELASDHVLNIISSLIQSYKFAEANKNGAHEPIAVYLYYATRRWLEKGNTSYKTDPQAGGLRFAVNDKIRDKVSDLRAFCVSVIKESLDLEEDVIGNDGIDKAIIEVYGRPNPHTDFELKRLGSLVYLQEDSQRHCFKIKFRNGLAYRCRRLDSGTGGEYFPYDSLESGESEKDDGRVHYAMDARGRLYVGYIKKNEQNRKDFYHSSLTGGQTVFSAGTMKIVQGKIKEITNDSGHYTPDAKHLANALYLLQLRGVPLEDVEAVHFKTGQHVKASDIMTGRKWPEF